MPTSSRHAVRLVAPALFALAGILACADVGPPPLPPASPVTFNDSLTATVTTTPLVFHTRAELDGAVAVLMRPLPSGQVTATLGPRPGLAWRTVTSNAAFAMTTRDWVVHAGDDVFLTLTGVGEARLRLVGLVLGPESAPAELTAGVAVTESIATPSDVDVFTFAGLTGGSLVISLEASANGAPLVRLTTLAETTAIAPSVSVLNTAAYPYLTAQRQARYDGLGSGPFRVVVSSGGAAAVYTLRAIVPSRQPELAPAAVSLGARFADSIGFIGDTDVYRVSGPPGARYEVFLRHEASPLNLHLTGRSDTLPTTEGQIVPGGHVAYNGIPMPFTMPDSGAIGLQVEGRSPTASRIPYQVEVWRMNPYDETGDSVLTVGVPSNDRWIDVPYDEDRFVLDIADSATYAVQAWGDSATHFALLSPAGDTLAAAVGPEAYGSWFDLPDRVLMPGRYYVVVYSNRISVYELWPFRR